MKTANVFDADCDYAPDDPNGYRAGIASVGREVGGQELAIKVFEIPAGESVSPYHYEYVEEWLLVIEGSVNIRTPDGEHQLRRGDLVRFAPGPDGAHKVRSGGEGPARVVMFSSSREPAVAVYPDSDKIGVWPGRVEDHVMLRRADGHVGYYEGER